MGVDRVESKAKRARERVEANSLVERDLLASGSDDTAGSGTTSRSTSTSATTSVSTESSTTTSSTATSSTSVTESTSTTSSATSSTASVTTESTSATSLVVVLPGRGVVQSDAPSGNILTGKSVQSCLGLVDILELDVSESLGGTSLPVGDESDRLNATVLAEGLVDGVLVGLERQVSDEKSLGRLGGLVAKLAGSLLPGTVGRGGSGRGKVDVDLSSVNLLSVHLLDGLGGILDVDELDVSESSRLLGGSVEHDSGGRDLTELVKLGLEPVVVDVPRELADEDVGRSLLVTVTSSGNGTGLGLALLGGGLLLILGLSLSCDGQKVRQ